MIEIDKIYAAIDEMEDELHEQMYFVEEYSSEMELLEEKISLLAELKKRLMDAE